MSGKYNWGFVSVMHVNTFFIFLLLSEFKSLDIYIYIYIFYFLIYVVYMRRYYDREKNLYRDSDEFTKFQHR
jgi:hypothetical protein